MATGPWARSSQDGSPSVRASRSGFSFGDATEEAGGEKRFEADLCLAGPRDIILSHVLGWRATMPVYTVPVIPYLQKETMSFSSSSCWI